MAAGGTFQSQNKVRPGAYINFIGTPKSLSSIGERGVVAAPMSLGWGAVNDAQKTHDDIVDALNAGKLILSRRKDDAIVIEKDQNTLHTFTPTKSYIFSKNRSVRVLDQIGNDIPLMFNKGYLGKISNNEEGRNIFKNDLAGYFRDLEKMGAESKYKQTDRG